MKKFVSILLYFTVFLVISGCSSSSADTEENELNSNIETGVVTAVQNVVEQTESMANIDWPWGFDDYNIVDNGDGTYDTSGEFTWQDSIYRFDITVETDDGDSGRIIYYNVY